MMCGFFGKSALMSNPTIFSLALTYTLFFFPSLIIFFQHPSQKEVPEIEKPTMRK